MPELSQEQKQAAVTELKRKGEAESLRFRGLHPEYNNTPENNALLAAYIRDNNLEWTANNLEIALDHLDLTPRTPEQTAKAEPVDPVLPDREVQQFDWPPLTAKIINNMDRRDYRRFVKNPEFVRQVGELKFRR